MAALALAAQIDAPAGMVMDGSGALYFADNGNNRVRRLSPQAIPPPAAVTAAGGVAGVGGQRGESARGAPSRPAKS